LSLAFPRSKLSARSFSSTPSHSAVLDTACGTTFTIIDTIHSTTGLSWAITLPLTALLVRTVIVFPIALWGQSHINKLLQINPVIRAWRPVFQHRIMAKHSHRGAIKCHMMLSTEMRKKQKEIHKSFGLKRWPAYSSLIQLPVWLLVIETIRKMCGTREGLLGMAATSWSSAPATGVEPVAASVPLVESLATEGALWFPNLLASDPQLVLPFVLSGTMFANIYSSHQEAKREGKDGKWSTRLSRVLMTLALAIGPLTLHVPSAMLVYWITSAGTAFGQRVLIGKIMPKPLSATPCRPKLPQEAGKFR
jgi:inner membrane protein COX18